MCIVFEVRVYAPATQRGKREVGDDNEMTDVASKPQSFTQSNTHLGTHNGNPTPHLRRRRVRSGRAAPGADIGGGRGGRALAAVDARPGFVVVVHVGVVSGGETVAVVEVGRYGGLRRRGDGDGGEWIGIVPGLVRSLFLSGSRLPFLRWFLVCLRSFVSFPLCVLSRCSPGVCWRRSGGRRVE